MTFHHLLLVLHSRLRPVLTVTLLTVLTTLAISLMLPKKYTASTAVVIDVKSPDPIAGMVLPGMISPGYMATQVDIINSDRVARHAAKLLHLDENPIFRQQWQEATDGQGALDIWLATKLQQKLDVKPARESNVININFSGTDPAFVAAAANAFAQAYIDVNLELKVEPARQNAVWFEEQRKLVRDRLEAAQEAYSNYRQRAGIVTTDEQFDSEIRRLNELAAQLTVVEGQTTENNSKQLEAGGSGALPEILQNPLINSLKTDIARLESKIHESSINLGKNHPQTQRSESELALLSARLESETRKIVSSIGATYRVSKQKEKELRESIEQQKARVLGLNRHRDEISVLKRDVETAQRAFEEVSLRSAQTRLESLSVLTNVIVLNPAFEPTEHSSPKVRLNALISLVLGTLLGAGLALAQELANRRVHLADDLAGALNTPLLAAIPHAVAPPVGLLKRPLALLRIFSPRRSMAAKATT